jgi:molybdenum cofactor synthesis domain-containing protein
MALLSYEAALELMLVAASPLESTIIPITAAFGRRLYGEVAAAIDLPRFDNSQMDGYAVRFEDANDWRDDSKLELKMVGTMAAGSDQSVELKTGEAIKIFTGAPMPGGADTVVPIEDVSVCADGGRIIIYAEPVRGQFVRRRGEDVTAGQIIGRTGNLINAGRIALLLSAGVGEAAVYKKPKVVVLTNGDELVDPLSLSGELLPGQIYESNGAMLGALVTDAGAELAAVIASPDSETELEEKISTVVREVAPDLIISSGGVSVGDRDYVRSAVSRLGKIVFWRAAIRPGKPILYGNVGGTHFLGLPGNPASTMVTFELFARPLLAKVTGGGTANRFIPSRLEVDIEHALGRRSFVRSITRATADGLVSKPAGEQGSHFVTSMAGANSLITLPEDVSILKAGSCVDCLLIGPLADD